jgi:hypothetical protein
LETFNGRQARQRTEHYTWVGGGGGVLSVAQAIIWHTETREQCPSSIQFILGLIREAKDTHLVVHQGAVLSARFAPSLFMHGWRGHGTIRIDMQYIFDTHVYIDGQKARDPWARHEARFLGPVRARHGRISGRAWQETRHGGLARHGPLSPFFYTKTCLPARLARFSVRFFVLNGPARPV